jgi:mRNA interferase MazF
MSIPSYSRHDVVLIRYPFSDLSGGKVRPAIIVNAAHISQDLIITPLTSRTENLLPGEFLLEKWQEAGLNVPSVVKRGLYTIVSEFIEIYSVCKIFTLLDELQHPLSSQPRL